MIISEGNEKIAISSGSMIMENINCEKIMLRYTGVQKLNNKQENDSYLGRKNKTYNNKLHI